MDKFVKRYYHYEKDEHGNDIKVANMISQKSPEHSEAFECYGLCTEDYVCYKCLYI